MSAPHSASSHQQLLTRGNTNPLNNSPNMLARDPTNLSTKDIGFKKVLDRKGPANEQTVYQVEIENESLLRTTKRSELASKQACLTRRWQTALVTGLVLVALAAAIGK
jgi:hypothetical protein